MGYFGLFGLFDCLVHIQPWLTSLINAFLVDFVKFRPCIFSAIAIYFHIILGRILVNCIEYLLIFWACMI